MARAQGNDLCELFGFAPDDPSDPATAQWKSQECPFVGNTCIKHDNQQSVIYGTCSVVNYRGRGLTRTKEEVIICPQRLYAENYKTLKSCVSDALQQTLPVFMADEYSTKKAKGILPKDLVVLLGQNSGKEITLSAPDIGKLSLDWVAVRLEKGSPTLILPCEVQSIDTTNNYHDAWRAYSKRARTIPDSAHGMNWANVWKRLIPQLILKGAAASTCTLCKSGLYFVLPERVYKQFLKVVGSVPAVKTSAQGTMTVMSYELGAPGPVGTVRQLVPVRTQKMLTKDFAAAFGAGGEMGVLGHQLEEKVLRALSAL
jgi:hypothetical protein